MHQDIISSQEKNRREWSAKYIQTESSTTKTSYLEWWYRLGAPPTPPPSASIAERENARRGRLASIVLLVELLIVLLFALPSLAFQNIVLIPAALGLGLLLCLALWFNHRGRTTIAGVLALLPPSIGIAMTLITTAGGLSANSIFLYDMMIQSVLIAVSLLPPGSVFIVTAINCIFIILDFNLEQHTADLKAMIAFAGPEVYARPIILHIIVAVVAYIWVQSATQAIKRADRAEVIAILEHDIAEQAHAIAQQKHRLDASIQQIVQTHVRVANGDINARVPLTQDNVLWEVAGALNNLLARFQRLHQAESKTHDLQRQLHWAHQVEYEAARTRKEVERQIANLRQAKSSQLPLRFTPTKTIIDPLLAELQGNYIKSQSQEQLAPATETLSDDFSSPNGNRIKPQSQELSPVRETLPNSFSSPKRVQYRPLKSADITPNVRTR